MSFRKPCHMPFRKLIPPFTLTGPELPHVTLWALICMNKRYKLRQQAKRTESEDLWREFKKARNEVTRQLRTAEALY